MGRVSVPSVGVSLSAPLRVVGLVGRYPTNYLMRRRPLKERVASLVSPRHRKLPRLSASYARLFGAYLRITTSSAGLPKYYYLGPLDLHALSTPPAFILS